VKRTPVYARQGGVKVHVQNESTRQARCGAELWGEEYLARLVPEHERCQASACRRAWPALLRVVG
jgi:hypothetical protein